MQFNLFYHISDGCKEKCEQTVTENNAEAFLIKPFLFMLPMPVIQITVSCFITVFIRL